MSVEVEGSVVVEAPVSGVYMQWTQFEDFPRFMGGVTSVRYLSETVLEWVVETQGPRQQWEAEILELVPEQKVAWAGIGGAANSGTVTFQETDDGHTQVRLVCEYDHVDATEGEAHLVRNSAEKDLQRFKELVEADNEQTQAQDGTIGGATSEPTG